MVPGGTLRAHNGGIIGPGAVDFIEGFRADYLITSIGAIEHDGTLLEFDVNEALVARTMIKHARNTLLVADQLAMHGMSGLFLLMPRLPILSASC